MQFALIGLYGRVGEVCQFGPLALDSLRVSQFLSKQWHRAKRVWLESVGGQLSAHA